MPNYSGQCLTVDNIIFTNPAGVSGVAQSFQFRYEFNTITLFGLNTLTTYVILTRPRGTASIVHALVEAGHTKSVFNTCKKGSLTVSAPGYSFATTDAILLRTEGRVTIESFIFNDITTYMFFSYT